MLKTGTHSELSENGSAVDHSSKKNFEGGGIRIDLCHTISSSYENVLIITQNFF